MRFSFLRSSINGPTYLRGMWSADRVAFVTLLCLLPPLGVAISDKGMPLFIVVALAIIVAVGWQMGFALLRKRRIGWDGIGTAIVFSLLVGEAVPLWQIALAVTFGIVLGEQVFGGRGFNFLNPTVVALAFLTFSFTGTSYAEPALWFGIAIVPSAVFLIATRLISWRMFVGIIAGLVAIGLLRGQTFQPELLGGSFLFVVVFLAYTGEHAPNADTVVFLVCDPVASSSTNLGRWFNGLLIGGLAWVFTPNGGIPTEPEALIPAILLASVFAPLIDTLVVMLNTYARRRPDV